MQAAGRKSFFIGGKIMRKILVCLLAAMALLVTACGANGKSASKDAGHAVILYTNDVHCGVSDNLGYVGLETVKNALINNGDDVLLIDNGDSIQGDTIGTLSKGDYIIDIMNDVGYDVATIGNHEFDYGMEQFFTLRNKADFPYISANFMNRDGETVLDSYVIQDLGNYRIAFVGASTPKTITTSTPRYFQNETGEYIFSFCQDETGEKFYNAIQTAVDSARSKKVDFVIVMAHLGNEASCSPWTSSELIENTNGIDAVLDGHDHQAYDCILVKNKDGKEVPLSSTGTKLANIGCLTIRTDGKITTKLINDAGVQDAIRTINEEFDELINEVVATTKVDLTTMDANATGTDGKPIRAIGIEETNLGDFCADAYRILSGADIGFINGGGIRSDIAAGSITYGNIISVHPFGNEICVVEVTGQQILDALEFGASKLPDENGAFLQVSGLTYTINMAVPSTVRTDADSMFTGVSGDYRVQDVKVGGDPLDLAKTYTVASHNYMLKDCGDGFSMFKDAKLVQDCVMIDNQVLINYITESLGGVVGDAYADPYGEGRINIING